MPRFFDPKKTKEEAERAAAQKSGGFGIMDLLEIAAPIAGTAVGGPLGAMLAGGAVTAIKGGVEGKGFGDILKDVTLGAGVQALTGGLGGGAAKGAAKGVTKEVATKTLGKGSIEGLTKEALTGTAKKGLSLGLTEGANPGLGGVGKGIDDAFSLSLGSAVEAGTPLSNVGTSQLGAVTDTAKDRFMSDLQGLGGTALGTYNDVKAEREQKRRFAEAQNINFMQSLGSIADGGNFMPPQSRFYQPYGG